MKKDNSFWICIGILVTIATAISAITTSILIHQKHKKEDEELEQYLDCSIQ